MKDMKQFVEKTLYSVASSLHIYVYVEYFKTKCIYGYLNQPFKKQKYRLLKNCHPTYFLKNIVGNYMNNTNSPKVLMFTKLIKAKVPIQFISLQPNQMTLIYFRQ